MEKVAIVTGASRGIGREIAKELAKEGIKVVANYNKSYEKAKQLQEELKKENIEIDIFKADVSKREEVKKLVEYTLEKYKKIDILINNAGISEYKLFTDETDEDWQRVINTNLYPDSTIDHFHNHKPNEYIPLLPNYPLYTFPVNSQQ